MARAESLTLDGACPSAQLIVESAVASAEAVRDHLYNVIGTPRNESGGSEEPPLVIEMLSLPVDVANAY
jgi:hypothetical protein